MKNAYGKLAAVLFMALIFILFFLPMRFGREDYLKVNETDIRLEVGESFPISYELYADSSQSIAFSSDDEHIADVNVSGIVTALSPGKTQIRLKASEGAKARINVVVSGAPITSIELNTRVLNLEKGDVSGLTAVINGGKIEAPVRWISGDKRVVTVDPAGRVSAVGSGETYVTATTTNGMAATARVHVYVPGTSVQITPGDITVGIDASLPLSVRFLPEDATDEPVKWFSDKPDIVSIGNDGVLHAEKIGDVTVTVQTRDGLVGTTRITVQPSARDLQINPTDITIERGETHLLEAWLIGENGQRDDTLNHHINWSSSNPYVASVKEGVVTGHASGIAYITASADGIRAVCAVHVQTTVRDIKLNMSELYLLKEQTGQTFQIQATLTPEDADNKTVIYASDNRLVATVSAKGLVTMTGGYGTAVITASTASGIQASFTIHVVTELPENIREGQALSGAGD
ncbi:MAG: Ig-like domain-containing protein [Christensenellales bacterium]|nr:Ig-like domain-containing protein [Christensenellales bacterium]